MEAKAVAKYVRMSPIKLKPVTDLVRGKDLNEALNILKFTPGKGSQIVEKVVKSAAANAENNFDMNPDNLYVAEVYAHQGPTMKRWRAGAQGRASIILKEIEPCRRNFKRKRNKIGGSCMGQKVSPHGLRVGVIKDWDSKWYGDKKNFADYLVEDHQVREYVKKKLYVAGVSKILIERSCRKQDQSHHPDCQARHGNRKIRRRH